MGFGDLDMDGDQDIYAVMGGAYEGDNYQNILFENPVGNTNNWINISLARLRPKEQLQLPCVTDGADAR